MTLSLTSPNEIYYKSRRFTVISSALLLLAVYVGLSPVETDSSTTIFSLKLNNPDYLSNIFLLVVLYAIWQFWTAWYVQTQEARGYIVNKLDCLITGGLAISAVTSFFYKFPAFPFWIVLIIALVAWYVIFFVGAQKLHLFVSDKIKKKDSDINSILVGAEWNLLFNPSSPNGSKKIIFLEDGNIGEGQNKNEATWRVREGLLEILNKDGKIFSRFRYNSDREVFEHTNDEDTLSIRHQKISRMVSK